MVSNAERVVEDLLGVLADIDALVNGAASEDGRPSNERTSDFSVSLAAARARLLKLKQSVAADVQKRAQTANGYIHDNAWASIGTAALVAFLAGLIIGRPRT